MDAYSLDTRNTLLVAEDGFAANDGGGGGGLTDEVTTRESRVADLGM